MTWKILKNYIPVLIGILIIGGILIWLSRCGDRIDIKAEQKEHKKIVDRITAEKEKIRADRDTLQVEVDQLWKIALDEIKKRVIFEVKIIELEAKDIEIPKETKPFQELTDCQKKHDELRAAYDNRRELVVQLKLEITSLKKTEGLYLDLKLKYEELARKNKEIEGKDKDIIAEDGRRIAAVIKRTKQSIFHIFSGGGIDSRGNFRFIIAGIGISWNGLFNLKF